MRLKRICNKIKPFAIFVLINTLCIALIGCSSSTIEQTQISASKKNPDPHASSDDMLNAKTNTDANNSEWRLVEEYEINDVFESVSRIKYSYSDDGKIITAECVYFEDDYFQIPSDRSRTTVKEFDDRGNLVKTTTINVYDGESKTQDTIITEYDDHDNKIHETITEEASYASPFVYESTWERRYDKNDNQTYMHVIDGRSNLDYEESYSYDANNNKIEERTYGNKLRGGDLNVLSTWEYDDHNNETQYYCKTICADGSTQESNRQVKNYYDGNQRVLSDSFNSNVETGERRTVGFFYRDKNTSQSVFVVDGKFDQNLASIKNDDGLCLVKLFIGSDGKSGNITAYLYENVNTGEKVSGKAYIERKSGQNMSSGYLGLNQILVDLENVYSSYTGLDDLNVDYDASNKVFDALIFDSSINTDPTDVYDVFPVGYSCFTDQFSFDIPEYWREKVTWTVNSDGNLIINPLKYPELNLISTEYVTHEEYLVAGDIGRSCLDEILLDNGEYLTIWATRWPYFLAEYNEYGGSDYLDYSREQLEYMTDLYMGGKPESVEGLYYEKGSPLPVETWDEYMMNTVVPAIVSGVKSR